MEKNQAFVKCPNCGNEFSADSAIENDVREKLQKEFQLKTSQREVEIQKRLEEIEKERQTVEKWKTEQGDIIKKQLEKEKITLKESLRKEAEDEFSNQLKTLQTENEEKNAKLKSLQQKEFEFIQKEKELKERSEAMEMEMQKKLNEREEEIKLKAEIFATQKAEIQLKQKESEFKRKQEELDLEIARKVSDATERVREEEKMKLAEIQKQMEDQKSMIEEMRKKSEQGSMQLQGEVQELELESLLKSAFVFDKIEEVGKGIKGADCVQMVNTEFGQQCGKIIYESKRTKAFSNEWLTKLKEDMRNTKADLAVIVTEALPKELNRFGMIDGVWVCTFAEVKSLAMVLRDSLIRINAAMQSQENKGDKMHMLYDYLTGNEFHQRIQAIVEGFNTLQDDLSKERKTMLLTWEKRSKQLDKVMMNTIAMYGSVKGIAGGAVQEIKGLEPPQDENLLL